MLTWWISVALAQEGVDPILAVVHEELERARAALSARVEAGDPVAVPYYLAAELVDSQTVGLRAEDGALHGINRSRSRRVDVDVRIGGPKLDSSHYLRSGNESPTTGGRGLPIGDDLAVLRRELWRELDSSWKYAVDRWSKVQADAGVLVTEKPAWDLAPVTPVRWIGEIPALSLDEGVWADRLRRVSAVLGQSGVIRDGAATLNASALTWRFASTEGTLLRHGREQYMLNVSLDTVADDGTVLDLSTIWVALSQGGLPSEAALLSEVASIRDMIAALREAPEQEPYTGPVMLSDLAAGVFFHEIFGHRVEGHRLKRVDNAQTFVSKVGQAILPTFLSVYDDPTRSERFGVPLNGYYRFDNEGVVAQRVDLVRSGVLQGFLESRSTITDTSTSNGHGRRSAGLAPVTRQGNLVVESAVSRTNAELRNKLVQLAAERGLSYGLLIDRIQGGFTFTQRGMPNAFNVDVLVAWRVFVDGRPDQLVRGVDLIGTPLDAFADIVAVGESGRVFNGVCGAESGWVPVSASSPSILVGSMETQKKTKGQERPPLLPPPVTPDATTALDGGL